MTTIIQTHPHTLSEPEKLGRSRDTTSFIDENHLDRCKRLFNVHASVHSADGSTYMTKSDFISALAPPYAKAASTAPSSEADATAPSYSPFTDEQYSLLFYLADQQRRSLVSFADFVVFQNLLMKSDAEFEVAFRLFDINGRGKVSMDEFRQVLKNNAPPPSAAKTTMKISTGETLIISTDAASLDVGKSELMQLYFGKGKSKDLTYEEFSQLLRALQEERLRQEFRRYDPRGTGYISIEVGRKNMRQV
jgi:solute carrier family 25 aspartate/glutamate transporter 12/13